MTGVATGTFSSYNGMLNAANGGGRPDADGYHTWKEVKIWARQNQLQNRDLYVRLDKIDFSKVKQSHFGPIGILEVKLAGKHFRNLNDGLVHGSIWLQINDNGYASIHRNTSLSFDFSWNKGGSIWRNMATKFLELDLTGLPAPALNWDTNYHYRPFNIYYQGSVYINE